MYASLAELNTHWCIRTSHTVLFLLPAADPLDLQEHLLLISLSRLLARTYKRQLLEDQMVASCGSCGIYWGEWCIL